MAYDVNWDWIEDVPTDAGGTDYWSSDEWDWAPVEGSYDAAVEGIDYNPGDYELFFGSPADTPQGYSDFGNWGPTEDYASYAEAPGESAGTYFGLQPPESAGPAFASVSADREQPWYAQLEGAAKKYPNMTSAGVGALSLLTSAYGARKKAKQQKAAYDAYLADKAARDAKAAKWNAPWVPTEFRTRNTAVAGPTVGDRYGVSSRGSDAVNSPANYDYFSKNRVQLAKGGLAQACCGRSGGQDDKVPAMLSHGEYVFDADAVSALGDGNNAAGAAKLDQMRQNLRRHKRAAPADKIPPKAKAPEAYLKGKK